MELIYKQLLANELDSLEVNLMESISSEIKLASEVSNHLVSSGGKRIRPVVCILIAKAFSYQGQDLIKLASSIELLHSATLIHDDVVDQSLIRRGKQSIHTKWDNAHGVLVGDFVYSKAFQLMASFENPKIIRTLANSTNRISEGEVLQLALKNREVLTEKEYFEIIDRKTAELFKSAALTAGILSSCSENQLSSLAKFATSLGISFQIQDDILDYFGNESLTGKRIGKDFEEGKFTLPVLIALKNMDSNERDIFLKLFENGEKESFPEVLQMLSTSNIREEIDKTFNYYSDICKEEIKGIPDNEYKTALEQIVSNLNSRLT